MTNKRIPLRFAAKVIAAGAFGAGLQLTAGVSHSITLEELAAKVERLEAENRTLKEQVGKLAAGQPGAKAANVESTGAGAPAAAPPGEVSGGTGGRAANGIVLNSEFSFKILDPTTNINRKQLLLLDGRRAGMLAENSLTIGGAVTAVVDAQSANVNGQFGYLMRQPGNQIGRNASEAAIHSAQLGFTGILGPWVTAYGEILYDPEQSFGAGNNTALARNQLQLRQGYVLLGNLDRSPFYASLGKMATPFGLTDTVNPFSASTVWHAFGGLANGVQVGYSSGGLNVSVMAVQGGSQFRGANTPVDGTNVPSKLNNAAANASYTWKFDGNGSLLAGASYQRGTIYCQRFPAAHFGVCQQVNPAADLYGELKTDRWTVRAEYARTLDAWAGTFNPALSQFAASKVTSWSLGTRYRASFGNQDVFLSAEYSRFVTGPKGSPWERQDQFVLGVASFLTPSVKLFGEFVNVNGFVPFQLVGSLGANRGAHSNVILTGVNAAF